MSSNTADRGPTAIPSLPPSPRRTGSSAAADISFSHLNSEHRRVDSGSPAAEKRRSSDDSIGAIWTKHKDGERGKRRSALPTPVKHTGDTLGSRGSTPRKFGRSGGFLLHSLIPNGHEREPRRAKSQGKSVVHENGTVKATSPVEWDSGPPARGSVDSSQRNSPLSRELSRDGVGSAWSDKRRTLQSSDMDPAQLVQLALNLNESRKRHSGSALPVPVASAGRGIRPVSALDFGHETVRAASSGGKRASLLSDRQELSSPNTQASSQQDALRDGDAGNDKNALYTFSPATLSRAEKARRYFELASEHRRLLEHLPPLKSDSTVPGSAPTGHAPHGSRGLNAACTYDLGRAYNPLQALRNRRIRNREKRPLPAPPDTWQETDRIKFWIDGVEAASKDSAYRFGEDQIRLPAFPGELDAGPSRPSTAKRHTRTDTSSSIALRPQNGWGIEPAELLADIYWVEKNDNKTLLEDRHGRRVCSPRGKPSLDSVRRSKDSGQAKEPFANRDITAHELDHDNDNDDDDDEDDKFRARHRLLHIPSRLRRGRISRTGSVSSVSSNEGRRPPPLQYGDGDGDENIGPLERHMRDMIAREEAGDLSPESPSPDLWGTKQTTIPNSQLAGKERSSTARRSSGRSGHARSKSADDRVWSRDDGVSSTDHMPSVRKSQIPRQESVEDHNQADPSNHRRIPLLHSFSQDQSKAEPTEDGPNNGKLLSPILSADSSTEVARSSLDSPRSWRPPFTRIPTTESFASSLRRMDMATDAAKDASVQPGRRFFRGSRRIGDLMRSEGSRLGEHFRGNRNAHVDANTPDISRVHLGTDTPDAQRSKSATDTPDAFGGQSDALEVEDQAISRYEMDGQTDSHVSQRNSLEEQRPPGKFFTSNLPSFRSPSSRDQRPAVAARASEATDATGAQQERPGPPRINLPRKDSLSDAEAGGAERQKDAPYSRSASTSQNDLSLVETNATLPRQRRNGLPVTGLAGHDAKRQWSISDGAQPNDPHKLSKRELARVRTLLLATGIKASEIHQQAETVPPRPSQFFEQAAQTAGQTIHPVPRKEELVAAARLLCSFLSSTRTALDQTTHRFDADAAPRLAARLDALARRADATLAPAVDAAAADAEAFTVDLTTRLPHAVRRLDDALDDVARRRRRRFRQLRRTGFKLLEWSVLVALWAVWLVVVLFNTARKLLFLFLRACRWLLWW